MTNVEINVAIAEACEIEISSTDKNGVGYRINPTPSKDGELHRTFVPIPNYAEDLNAMYVAEETLNPSREIDPSGDRRWHNYRTLLLRVVEKANTSSMHPSAKQRAEAFLRAFEKWID